MPDVVSKRNADGSTLGIEERLGHRGPWFGYWGFFVQGCRWMGKETLRINVRKRYYNLLSLRRKPWAHLTSNPLHIKITWYATPLKATGADASFCFRCHPVRKSRITLLRNTGLSCGNILRLILGLGKFWQLQRMTLRPSLMMSPVYGNATSKNKGKPYKLEYLVLLVTWCHLSYRILSDENKMLLSNCDEIRSNLIPLNRFAKWSPWRVSQKQVRITCAPLRESTVNCDC